MTRPKNGSFRPELNLLRFTVVVKSKYVNSPIRYFERRSMMSLRRKSAFLAVSAAVLAAVALTPATAIAAGPPAAATAFKTAVVTPEGGSVTGFGITATFAPDAVTTDRLIVLGNWPNGLDVTPPAGTTAVKTFGIQECNLDYTGCTSVFGNFAHSPAGSEKIRGQVLPYSSFQQLGTTNTNGNTTFGTKDKKLVTITTHTTADSVYIYNANNNTTATAYPKLLPSTSDGTTLTFQTFQPIVWTLTAPSN